MARASGGEIDKIKAMLRSAPPTAGSFRDRRDRWEEVYRRICPVPEGTLAAPIGVPGILGEWVSGPGVAEDRSRPVFYLHGSGFTAGNASAYRGLAARLSTAASRSVLTVDYRHAPEEPFPAALEDCVAAWRWLVGDKGTAPEKVVLLGDSAGGNLVVAMMLALRADGTALPAGAVPSARKAKAAGVDISIEEGDGMIHVWHLFADRLPEARAAIDRIGAFVLERAP